MPYMTVRYVGLTPTIEAQAGSPITWLNSLPVSTTAGDPPTAATGTVFKVREPQGPNVPATAQLWLSAWDSGPVNRAYPNIVWGHSQNTPGF